jgi:hypothetical protein
MDKQNQIIISEYGLLDFDSKMEYVLITELGSVTKMLLIILFAKWIPNASSKPSSNNVIIPIKKAKQTK